MNYDTDTRNAYRNEAKAKDYASKRWIEVVAISTMEDQVEIATEEMTVAIDKSVLRLSRP